MARHQHYAPKHRSTEALADARDLRATISAILAAAPIDQGALRQAVWTYVGTERDAGVSPGLVIMSLTELLRPVTQGGTEEQELLMRNVILWSVEAYFGHLGGDVFRMTAGEAVADAPTGVPS
jgi:hypothetical protein